MYKCSIYHYSDFKYYCISCEAWNHAIFLYLKYYKKGSKYIHYQWWVLTKINHNIKKNNNNISYHNISNELSNVHL